MFRATNFAVTTLLLVAFTVFMAVVRRKRSLDNNWPVIYWMLVMVFTLVRSEETFSFEIVVVGLLAALMLRFEFMNDIFVKFFRLVELVVFGYVIYRGVELIIV